MSCADDTYPIPLSDRRRADGEIRMRVFCVQSVMQPDSYRAQHDIFSIRKAIRKRVFVLFEKQW